jgi:elongation factor Ts
MADDGRAATLVAVACESEPVSKTPMFQEFVDRLLAHVEQARPSDAGAVLDQPWSDDPATTVGESVNQLVARLGENIQIRTVTHMAVDGAGVVGTYVHHDHKSGALVAVGASEVTEALKGVARELAMHVVFAKPSALSREDVPQADQGKERDIIRGQLAEDPKMAKKPAEVLDKIAAGKMTAFFRAQVLPDGASVRDFLLVQIGG